MPLALLGLFLLAAAAPEEPPAQEEPEVVVTASPLRPPDEFDAPYHVTVLDADEIRTGRMSRTLPEALRDVVGIATQKTGPGQGSPYLRGVTGYRNLLLVDGIRVNNSTWRQGPVQYWGLVDRYVVDRLEVMRGPASYLYGSDSIGGTVVAYSAEPEDYPEGFHVHPTTLLRVAGAERSVVGRAEATGNLGALGFAGGFTTENYGNLQGGPHTDRQRNTAYDAWDGDLKLVYRPDEDRRFVAAWQTTRLEDHPRTHRTRFAEEWHGTTVGTDRRLDLDNRRDLAYAQVHWDRPDLFFDRAEASVSWQHQEERESRTRASFTQDLRFFEVDTLGVWARASNDTRVGTLTYGFDWYRDWIQSEGRNVTLAGAVTPFDRGVVSDDTTYDLAGLYLQDDLPVCERVDLTLGGRLNYAAIDAGEVDFNPADALPLESIDEDWTSVVGSARAVWHVADGWNVVAGVSQGFRAPSVDDVTSVSFALSGTLDIPSPGIDPERTVTYEAGVRAEHDAWEAEAFVYLTEFQEVIERSTVANPFAALGIGGATANQRVNFDEGRVYGVELSDRWRALPWLEAFGDFAYTFGESERLAGSGVNLEPMDKVPPATAHVGVRIEPPESAFWIEGLATLVGRQDRLSPTDETDTQRIPPGGTPGYSAFTVRGGWSPCDAATLTLAVENIGDRDYRAHGSGTNEPGLNVIGGLEVRW